MGFRKKLNYSQKVCLGRCGKLMLETKMIYPGARVGIALSGGVDSWLLTQALLFRQKIVPFPFEIILLHVNPGFEPQNHQPLIHWLKKNPVPAHIQSTDIGIKAHQPENKKSSCFLCSWNRRKILFELCRKYSLTHLAFGHNAEDLAVTFFMNMIQTAKVEGLSARESFFEGRLTIIRPLLLIEKKYIRNAARKWSLPVWDNPCPSAKKCKRAEIEEAFHHLTHEKIKIRQNILNALKKWQVDITMDTA